MLRRLTILTVLGTLLVPATASAYNPIEVHRWIARQAVAHLVATYPGQYDEAAEYLEAIARGAEHEDDTFLDGDETLSTVRLMRHFYRPSDLAGLSVEPFGTFPNSYEWGGAPNAQNEWGWDDAFARYAEGDREAAYFALGHVVHLVSDLTVPAHVHLDDHGPPYGDDYENYTTNMTENQFSSRLPVPAPGAEVNDYADIQTLWHATAMASYWRNLYPGDLSDTDAAAGGLVEMFGDGVSFSVFSGNWSIDGVGSLGSAFEEHEPGYYYFAKLQASPLSDRSGFDMTDPTRVTLGAADDRRMVERLADDLVPLAILQSAAAIKLFLDSGPTVDAEPTPDPEDDIDDASGCSVTSPTSTSLFFVVLLACLALRRRRN